MITDTEFIADFKARMLPDTESFERAQPRHATRARAAWRRVVAHVYFYGIVGTAQLVAPYAPTLTRR